MREVLELALEGLEKWGQGKDPRGAQEYITAIEEALAQPEPTSIGKSIANEEAYWRDEMLSGD